MKNNQNKKAGMRLKNTRVTSSVARRKILATLLAEKNSGRKISLKIGSSSLHWLVKYAKSHVFGAFEADFWWKIENSPPSEKSPPSNVWISDSGRKISLKFGEDLFFLEITWIWAENTFDFPILAEKSASKPVFWWSPEFGRKKRLIFRFWPKKQSQNRWRPFFFFFGEHLNLGGKNVWFSDFGRKNSLKIGEDLFFFGGHLNLGGNNI